MPSVIPWSALFGMKTLMWKSSVEDRKLDKRSISRFVSFLTIPGLIYLAFVGSGKLYGLHTSLDPFVFGLNTSMYFCVAWFVLPLRTYQFELIPPATWEKTLFFENWVYIDTMYLFILAFILAIFTRRMKLVYSWAVYILVLVGSRIVMHLALNFFGYHAYYDLP